MRGSSTAAAKYAASGQDDGVQPVRYCRCWRLWVNLCSVASTGTSRIGMTRRSFLIALPLALTTALAFAMAGFPAPPRANRAANYGAIHTACCWAIRDCCRCAIRAASRDCRAAGRAGRCCGGTDGAGAHRADDRHRQHDGTADLQDIRQAGPQCGGELHRVGRGDEGLDDQRQPRQTARQAVLRRADLPPRDSRIHDPGGRPGGRRDRRPRLLLRRRDNAGADVLDGRAAGLCQLRPKHQRQPVLYHRGRLRRAEREVHHLRPVRRALDPAGRIHRPRRARYQRQTHYAGGDPAGDDRARGATDASASHAAPAISAVPTSN